MQRRQLVMGVAASAMATLVGAVHAAGFPVRPLTLIVPFAAGGGTDTVARLLGQRLAASLGQPVVVENRPGANGLLASRHLVKQPPDGHVLLLGSNSTHVIAPLTARAPEDGIKAAFADFGIVGVIANAPLVLAVKGGAAERDLAAFLNRARRERLSFGTFGVGSSAHVMGEVLADSAGLSLTHVAYKGSAQAMNDLLGGHVDSVFLTVAALKTITDAGAVRPLAVTGRSRVASLPGVPTFEELGVKDMANAGWFAIFVPGRTPAAVTEPLAAALRSAVAEPTVRARLLELGLEPVDSTPQEARVIWTRSAAVAAPIVQRAAIDPP